MRKIKSFFMLVLSLVMFSCNLGTVTFENGMYETLLVDSCKEEVIYCRIYKDDSTFTYHDYESDLYTSGKSRYKKDNGYLYYLEGRYKIKNNQEGIVLINAKDSCVQWYFLPNNKLLNHYYPYLDFCKSKKNLIKRLNEAEKLGIPVEKYLIDTCEIYQVDEDIRSIQQEIELME